MAASKSTLTDRSRAAQQRWLIAHPDRRRDVCRRYYLKKRAAILAAKALEPAPTTKRCASCETEKPFVAFGVDRKRKDALTVYCKPCTREIRLTWNAANRATKRAYIRKYYAAHKMKVLAIAEVRRQRRRREHPAEVRAEHRRHQHQWRVQNPERAREGDRRRRARVDPRLRQATAARWGKANRHVKNAHEMVRRAMKRHSMVEFVDPLRVFQLMNGVCGICQTAILTAEKWHVDHIRPLSKGGAHTYENTQPAHARCNLAKGAKIVAA